MTSTPDEGPAASDDRPHPPTPVTVVVAAPDERRSLLVHWLRSDGRFAVVGEAADPATAIEAIVASVPDVAFVDLALAADPVDPAGDAPADGVAALVAAHHQRPAVHLVAVADEDDDRAYAALAAGAMGLYLWNDPVATAVEVAIGVARGEAPLTPGWAGRILDEVRWLAREPGPVPAPELTPTELEVLRRVASGATPAAIAQLHGVTVHLVGVHAGVAVTKVRRHHDDLHQLESLRPT